MERFDCELFLFKRGTKGVPVGGGPRVTLRDPIEIRSEFKKYSHPNYSLLTGGTISCLDLDPDGYATLAALTARFGALESGPICLTPRGGAHFFFESPGLATNDGFLRGLDWHDMRGTIIGPGSIGQNGVAYTWVVTPDEMPLVSPPAWLIDLVRKPVPAQRSAPVAVVSGGTAYARSALHGECEMVRSAPHGVRNRTLNAAAFKMGTLIGAGVLDAEVAALALLVAAAACGLTESEARATIASGFHAGVEQPRPVVS